VSRSFTSSGQVNCGSVTLASTVSMGCWCRAPGTGNNVIIDVSNQSSLYFSSTTLVVEMKSRTWNWDAATHGLTLTNWNHIFITYDASSPATAPVLYTNGSVASAPSSSSGTGTVSFASATLRLGNFGSGSSPFGGDLAWIGVHNVILAAGEVPIAQHRGYAPRGVQRLYPLWGDATEPDLSGNVANGTVTSSTTATDPPVVPLWVPTDAEWVPRVAASSPPASATTRRRRTLMGAGR